MSETFDPSEGRGAWSLRGKDNGSIYYARLLRKRRDGGHPEYDAWHEAVHHGVRGIQVLLIDAGYDVDETGVFRLQEKRAIKAFQSAHGITVSGMVGMTTARALLAPVITRAAMEELFDPSFLYGIARQESGLDTGAQGFSHPADKGVWQDNTDFIESELAWDPIGAAYRTARRFRSCLNRYKGKGDDLRFNCAIAQHNAPAWADQWFETGEAPNDTIAGYVTAVRGFAEQWPAVSG